MKVFWFSDLYDDYFQGANGIVVAESKEEAINQMRNALVNYGPDDYGSKTYEHYKVEIENKLSKVEEIDISNPKSYLEVLFR